LDTDEDEQRMIAPPDRRVVIPALGLTQIFALGSTFYLPAALAPMIASDTGWPYDLTVGGVSVGLLVAQPELKNESAAGFWPIHSLPPVLDQAVQMSFLG
jgi:hypothetical protein